MRPSASSFLAHFQACYTIRILEPPHPSAGQSSLGSKSPFPLVYTLTLNNLSINIALRKGMWAMHFETYVKTFYLTPTYVSSAEDFLSVEGSITFNL